MGYHTREIPRGVYGEASKIAEETEEFMDSIEQGIHVMALCELSDLYGAIDGYLKKYHPEISMDDLGKMAAVTGRAFNDGTRLPRDSME